MSRIVSYLKDPIHVMRFQHFCGVPYTAEELGGKFSRTEAPQSNGTKNGPVSNGIIYRNKIPASNSDSKSDSASNGNVGGVGTSAKSIRGHFFFDLLFRFSSGLGGEIFYITFLPFLVWDVDFHIARRIVYLWTLVMYTGQALKDIFKWPRPPKPVKRLETWFDNEYGFPSTHAIVAASIPYGCWMLARERYDFPSDVGFVIASVWCLLVCLSRLYLGVHTLLDLLSGFSVAVVFLVAGSYFLDPMDDFIAHTPYSPLVVMAVGIALMAIYPKQYVWCPARGDTCKIVGVGVGVAWSVWYVGDLLTDSLPHDGTLLHVTWPSKMVCITCALRWFLGCSLLGIVRFVMKELALKGLPYVVPYDPSRPWREQVWMEVSVRMVTYGAIGFSVMRLAPGLFELAGKAVGLDLALKTL